MVRIEAIIQPFQFKEVKTALADIGLDGMTVAEVNGCGRQRGHAEVYRGQEYSVELRPKVKIEIVAHADDAEEIIRAICRAARTGNLGDGKIFVLPVAKVIRIRNGQCDEAAL
jgi:nitrogen regulatory protein P-II 1